VARLLNNGDEFLPAILAALRGAERSINFTTYIWEDGEMSDLVFAALIERARAGVAVRVLIDAFGGLRVPDGKIEELRGAGGRWQWFHPLRFGKLTRLHRRNHRRGIIVDGRIAFTGGASVMDKWLGDARGPDEWRDCMVELRGSVATDLQSVFCQLWSQVTGEMLVGADVFPSPREAERAESGPGEALFQHVNVISSPSSEAHPMRFVFWLSFRAARERIFITNPYFVPDRIMSAVLQERARAGVDVRVLVPNEQNDVSVIRWASRNYYEDLLRAGLRIYEYQPTMIHQKLVVVDGRWSVVGSVNMDVRSKELNQENAVGIHDIGFARQLEETFFRDLERAREITLPEFRRRPAWHRLPERALALLEEQF
jgi:cardiolipin synthase A/B